MNAAIVTNGTVQPSESICKIMAQSRVIVRMSRYKCVEKKRRETLEFLKKRNIIIEDLKHQKWFDVGGFEDRGRSSKELEQVFGEQ